ncbi:BTB/POZ domain-containing protein 9 [Nematostella vectensis]|uniref:BTB/POZ domain-containing protein 9 n=1 Tax=Nematostella vectensis TaxID=45351 RepID=UPI00138FE8AE|nr:BTB/POZ domain-containing protein 9 [Nematostella vectensis]
MGDNQDFQLAKIDHVELLSSQSGTLYQSRELTDVTFIVEKTKFTAHRVILAARSEYFRALLFGGMREANPGIEIEVADASSIAFDALLRYIYTGKMFLAEYREEIVMELLGLAHKYGFLALESAIQGYLKAILDVKNVCLIFDMASLYQLKDLYETCLEFLDANAIEVIASESFSMLSRTSLIDIIKRDSFCAPEVQIFRAVSDWIEVNKDSKEEDIESVLQCVRLTQISLHELFHTVRPTKLYSADAILDSIKIKTESRVSEMNFRGHLVKDENIATSSYGTDVIEGEKRDGLLDNESLNYDLDRGFSRHLIADGDKGICIALGRPSIINTIRMLLWDRDLRSYSYYIEVSIDNQDWVTVIDYSKYLCRSWQILHFAPRVVRYIRIIGTYNSVNKVFHLVHFECMYSTGSFKLSDNGIIVPSDNVAVPTASASVIEGVSRSWNALLNGETKCYDWNSGYTCHQVGSGSIVVQLAQPYFIGSMRLLLWDCDDRCYSYYIEVSTDRQHWTKVVDKSNEQCRAWQHLEFKPLPMTFIRIVGTHNTANEVFHCVHFECPSTISNTENCNEITEYNHQDRTNCACH